MKIPRLLLVVIAVAAVTGVGATPTVTPGEPLVVTVHGFPPGDLLRGTLRPGHVPLGSATVSMQPSVTLFVPVWAVPGRDRVVLVDGHGRRESVRVLIGPRVLPWPITMRLRGLR
jgi:hypothetical protein